MLTGQWRPRCVSWLPGRAGRPQHYAQICENSVNQGSGVSKVVGIVIPATDLQSAVSAVGGECGQLTLLAAGPSDPATFLHPLVYFRLFIAANLGR